MEKRRFERYSVTVPVVFSGDLLEGEGIAVNLSMGGCAVGSEASPPEGSFVHLRGYLAAGRHEWMKIELAGVRWAREQVFGVEFIRMVPAQQERLRQFIHILPMGPSR